MGVFISDQVSTGPYREYTIEGDKLLTNVDEIWVTYQQDTPEANWPGYFTELMVAIMAHELAYVITDQANLRADLFAIAYGTPQDQGMGGMMGTARNADSKDTPSAIVQDYTLLAARLAGGNVYNSGGY